MWVKILLGINVLLGICAVVGIGYNIIKTHVLTHNHINHLTTGQATITKKLESIDKTQVNQGKAIVAIQATCAENGKQITILQTKGK